MDPIRAALWTLLDADPQLSALATGIHHRVAPQDAAPPFVTFDKVSSTPIWSMAGAPIDNELWQVKGVSRGGDAQEAEAIAQRIDTLLTDAPLVVTGRDHLYLRRDSDVDYGEQDGAVTYHHSGGLYRLVTEAA